MSGWSKAHHSSTTLSVHWFNSISTSSSELNIRAAGVDQTKIHWALYPAWWSKWPKVVALGWAWQEDKHASYPASNIYGSLYGCEHSFGSTFLPVSPNFSKWPLISTLSQTITWRRDIAHPAPDCGLKVLLKKTTPLSPTSLMCWVWREGRSSLLQLLALGGPTFSLGKCNSKNKKCFFVFLQASAKSTT